jgi:hypothetical protein
VSILNPLCSCAVLDTAESYDDDDSYEGSAPQDGEGLVSNDQRSHDSERPSQSQGKPLGRGDNDGTVLGLANPRRGKFCRLTW